MNTLRTLLTTNGFKVTADDTFTKLACRCGLDASPSSMEEYINECRNAKGFKDYKIVPNGNGFLIATDYCYTTEIEKLNDYANAIIKEDLANHYANIRFEAGSFDVVVVDGKLAFKYVSLHNSMMDVFGAEPEHTDERPELERRIIEYAMKILPEEIQPEKEGQRTPCGGNAKGD